MSKYVSENVPNISKMSPGHFETNVQMLALFPDVFPDACLVLRFAILPPAGQRSRKNTSSGLGLGILPPAGQRSQKNHVPGKKHAYIAYIAHVGPKSVPMAA